VRTRARAQHGCPGSGFDFRYLGAELERAGMRVIRVDLPGNDRTPLQVLVRLSAFSLLYNSFHLPHTYPQHALQATEGMGDPADGRVLGALVTEIADKLNLAQPLLLAHSVGSQVGGWRPVGGWRFTCRTARLRAN